VFRARGKWLFHFYLEEEGQETFAGEHNTQKSVFMHFAEQKFVFICVVHGNVGIVCSSEKKG
jgi:hypothetical protein